MYKLVMQSAFKLNKKALFHWTMLGFAALLGVGYITAPAFALQPASTLAAHPRLPGYIPEAELPDSTVYLPPPLANTDATVQAADDAAYQRSLKLKGTARWELAIQDVNISKYPEALASFACAIGFMPSEVDTPNLVTLLRRTRTDAGGATRKAKDAYNRIRPYVKYKTSTCGPSDETRLSTQGAYPSGHASTGWAWALVLAELMPSKATAILERGTSFGQSRVVCGYHWQSDISAGQLVAAATVAVMHASPDFKAQMATARAEIEKKLSMPLFTPLPKCPTETPN